MPDVATATRTPPGVARPGRSAPARWPPGVVYLTSMLVLSAMFGGIGAFMLISDPTGAAWGIPTVYRDLLPVDDFLLPGLFLLVAFCILPAALAVGLATRWDGPWAQWVEEHTGYPWTWAGTVGLAFGLIAWIAVEVALFSSAPSDTMTNLWVMVLALAGALLIGASLPSVRRYCSTT